MTIGKKRQRKVTNDLLDLSLLYENVGSSEPKKRQKVEEEILCPYLGQIRRHMLDFDFHKQCSISINTLNVYCCLVCGKYF